MSTLQVDKRSHGEIYTLVDNTYSFSIDPIKGGQMISFKNGDNEYINFISILFPDELNDFVNMLSWKVYHTGNESIILSLTEDEITKETYSSDFLLVLRYTLLDNKATISLTVKNNTKEIISYNIGFKINLYTQSNIALSNEKEGTLIAKDKNHIVTMEFNQSFINTIEKQNNSIILWDSSKGNGQKELLNPEDEKTFILGISIS